MTKNSDKNINFKQVLDSGFKIHRKLLYIPVFMILAGYTLWGCFQLMSSELAWKSAESKAKKFQVFFFHDPLFLPDQQTSLVSY